MKQRLVAIVLLIGCVICSKTICAQHPEPVLISDIYVGDSNGIKYPNMIGLGNELIFSANNGTNDIEPWITDGTPSGSNMIKNIAIYTNLVTIDGASNPSEFILLGDKVLFSATYLQTGIEDRELFITDGTTGGTSILKNINATNLGSSSNPSGYVILGNLCLFAANDGVHGRELWVTDGTSAGTQLLKDCQAGPLSSNPKDLRLINGKVYFAANNDAGESSIWVTDGTSSGTTILKSDCTAFFFTEYQGKIYFCGSDDSNGQELWVSDGTPAGTTIFKDLNPGLASSVPENFIVHQNKLFFSAYDATHGRELWVSDGTVSGTQMIDDIYPGIQNSSVNNMIVYNDQLFFTAKANDTDNELWSTDGTLINTKKYVDINPGSSGSYPANFKVYNNRMYFVAHAADMDRQYWCIEGDNSPFKIKPSSANVDSSLNKLTRHSAIEVNGSLYFPAKYRSDIGVELYKMTTTAYEEPTAIRKQDLGFNIEVYPNPASNVLILKTPSVTSITIINSLGQGISWHKLNLGENTIDISNLTPGLYHILSEEGGHSKSFVKQ